VLEHKVAWQAMPMHVILIFRFQQFKKAKKFLMRERSWSTRHLALFSHFFLFNSPDQLIDFDRLGRVSHLSGCVPRHEFGWHVEEIALFQNSSKLDLAKIGWSSG
jgi:hypothetical protein